jgi:hypothetical protein
MYRNEETLISKTGLRYTSKENGSPFQGMGATGDTMSCIKCGNHRLRSNGSIVRYLNSPMFFCFDCKPLKAKPVQP